jgi:hypothetical protein
VTKNVHFNENKSPENGTTGNYRNVMYIELIRQWAMSNTVLLLHKAAVVQCLLVEQMNNNNLLIDGAETYCVEVKYRLLQHYLCKSN